MKKIRLRLGSSSYDILVGSGLLDQTAAILKETGYTEKLVMVTDSRVKSLYGNALKQSLIGNGFKVLLLEVAEGEEQKSLETAGRLYQELTDFYAERMTPVIALGGGVIGDLTGFVAATYLRGVPLVQIPTTLLAQVDSSIGGKVAVNHGLLKNKIGAFYQPKLVISDIAVLKSLTPGDLSDGLAEAIKYGVIWDEKFFTYIEGNLDRIKSFVAEALEKVVSRAAEIKAAVVEKDEKDFNLRNILNYGHTIGHAIETVSDFKVPHGEAVALGMLAAARISNKLGILDGNEVRRLKEVITRAGLPTKIPALQLQSLTRAMKHDKKILQGKIRFILPRKIGEVFITDEVSHSLVEEVLLKGHE
ncbi:MAG: 3-dehydroquinate synthase [Dehalococcoidales bacterium]|nr:3-dehydroquinate synthase [Dehalococcoidales bacterium]